MIDPTCKDILDRYAAGAAGALTGSTRAIVHNDFLAVANAWPAAQIRPIAEYLWNELPLEAWGSPEKVRAWTWRHEVARHPDAPRRFVVERDRQNRLGDATHLVAEVAVIPWGTDDDGKPDTVDAFVRCEGIFPTEQAAYRYLAVLKAVPTP